MGQGTRGTAAGFGALLPATPAGHRTGGWTAKDLELPERTAARIAEAIPDNTRRNWVSRWRPFALWCLLHGRCALPATPETLAAYLDARTRDFAVPQGLPPEVRTALGKDVYAALGPSSLAGHLGTLRAAHRLNGHPAPDPYLANQVIKVRARELAKDVHAEHGVRQATPLLAADITAMVDAIDRDGGGTGAAALRDKALLLLAYRVGRRGAELAALNITDVRVAENPADPKLPALGLRVTFPLSKTNPHGLRRDDVARVKRIGGRYCAYTAVVAWLKYLAAQGYTSGPLFPRIDMYGNLGEQATGRQGPGDDGRITPKSVDAIVKRRATDAGLVPEDGHRAGPDDLPVQVRITAHSTRRGYVTDALSREGVDPEKVGRQAGFAPGSRTLYRYREVAADWDDPTSDLVPGDGRQEK